MSSYVLTNAGIWLDQFDLSADFNTVSVGSEVEEQDATTFGADTRTMKGGLKMVSLSGAGFFDAGPGEPDTVLFPRIGSGSTALSIAAKTTAAGDPAYFVQPNVSRYEFNPQVGEIKPFSFGAVAKGGPLVGGVIGHNNTRTASGVSTGYELGAVASGEKLYAALHVISASGTAPTLDVVIQSDVDSSFTTPVDQITFSQATAAGAQWGTPASGAIADTFFRVSYTIAGTSPSFLFVVTLGIA